MVTVFKLKMLIWLLSMLKKTNQVTQKIISELLTLTTIKDIANHNNVSPSTVVNVLNESVTLSSFTLHDSLPEHLCFDEVRTNDNQLSFICIDVVKHTLVALLPESLAMISKNFLTAFSRKHVQFYFISYVIYNFITIYKYLL